MKDHTKGKTGENLSVLENTLAHTEQVLELIQVETSQTF